MTLSDKAGCLLHASLMQQRWPLRVCNKGFLFLVIDNFVFLGSVVWLGEGLVTMVEHLC